MRQPSRTCCWQSRRWAMLRSGRTALCAAMVSLDGLLNCWACLRDARWRYIHNNSGHGRLVDLMAGSSSTGNTEAQGEAEVERLRRDLLHWVKNTPDVATGATGEMSDEIRKMLEKAGYLDESQ